MSDYLKEGFIDEVKGCLGGRGGQENVIESIKVNGVGQTVDENKAVNIPVPTKTSDLDNDSGYQTNSEVSSTVAAEVAKIVADAPEDFDTLKEMSDWISQHEDSAAAMNSAILKNKEDISSLYTSKADVSDVQTVEASVDELNSNLDGLGYGENGAYNLIQPTLQTTTVNGVTCTNNEDGTYTLNGTSTGSDGWGLVFLIPNLEIGKKYKLIGFDTTSGSFYLKADKNNFANYGNNGIFTNSKESEAIYIKYNTGVTFDNVIVKPMLTTDLTATYDDFKPYIPSVKMLADEVSAQNDSLNDYGLVNQFSGNVVQGYHAPNTGVYDSSYKYAVTDTTKYPCVAGNDVSVKVKGNANGVFIIWYNGASYLSYTSVNSLEINAKAPTNATNFTINIQSGSQITPQAISHIGVYIDNVIDKLKNDLMFKNVWSGEIYKANETATISNFSNSKKYLFEFKAKSIAYKRNVIVLGNQVYIEVPLIAHASTIAFTLYRLNISSNGVVTISDVINEDSGASLVNIYEI